MVLGTFLLQAGGGLRASVPSLITHASLFSKIILLVLVAASIYSWAVIWNRLRRYASLERADRAFLEHFRRTPPATDLRPLCMMHPNSQLSRLALAGQRALESTRGVNDSTRAEIVMRAIDRAASDETASLEQRVSFLATTGSVSPFVGLLGTVWGVMSAFLNIGAQGSASLAVVAPGIAEALIATVVGLAAAIPAVVGYNHCLGRLRDFANAQTRFAGEFVDRALSGSGA